MVHRAWQGRPMWAMPASRASTPACGLGVSPSLLCSGPAAGHRVWQTACRENIRDGCKPGRRLQLAGRRLGQAGCSPRRGGVAGAGSQGGDPLGPARTRFPIRLLTLTAVGPLKVGIHTIAELPPLHTWSSPLSCTAVHPHCRQSCLLRTCVFPPSCTAPRRTATPCTATDITGWLGYGIRSPPIPIIWHFPSYLNDHCGCAEPAELPAYSPLALPLYAPSELD